MRVHDTSVPTVDDGVATEEGPDAVGSAKDPCAERDDRCRRVLEAVALGCTAGGSFGACQLTTLRGLTGFDLADLEDEVIYLEGEGLVEIEDLAAPRPKLRVRITAAGEDYLAERGNSRAQPEAETNGEDS